QSMHVEALCDGTKLVAARLYNLRITAVRASYEELASALEGRPRGKPILATTLAELPRKVSTGEGTLGCTLLVPATHAQVKRARPGAAARPHAAAAGGASGLSFTPDPPAPPPAALLPGGLRAQDPAAHSLR